MLKKFVVSLPLTLQRYYKNLIYANICGEKCKLSVFFNMSMYVLRKFECPQGTKVYGKNKINGSNGLNEGNTYLKYKNNYVQVV